MSTTSEDQDTDVFPDEAEKFRAAVARLNWLGQDSRDVQFPAKVLSSEMGQPNDGELEETKEGRPVSCWKKASCVATPLAVRGGDGPAEGDHGCRLGWR